MPAEHSISLAPKARFLSDKKGAAAHSDAMSTPAFHAAATAALVAYQQQVLGGDPAVLAISAAKLRGASEYLRVLLNLGLPDAPETRTIDTGLIPPEEALTRPYAPPKQ